MYKDSASNVKKYTCKINEAVVFSSGFEHATELYAKTDNSRVMLSFTFGTDKTEHWEILKKTIGEQPNYMILPCGHQKGSCGCRNEPGVQNRKTHHKSADGVCFALPILLLFTDIME